MAADAGPLVGVGMWVVLGAKEFAGTRVLVVCWSPSSHANVREVAIKVRQTMGTINHADRLRLFRLAVFSNILVLPAHPLFATRGFRPLF